MRFLRLFFLLATIIVAFPACNKYDKKQKVSILKVTEEGLAKVSDKAIVDVLRANTQLDVDIVYSNSVEVALEKLRNNEIEMAIIPNNTQVSSADLDIRAITSLLPRILVVIRQNEAKGDNLKELLENNLVIVESLSGIDSLFTDQLAENYQIDISKVKYVPISNYKLEENLDQPAVYIGLTHLHNPIVKQLLHSNWLLYSLDDVANLNHGSSVEGFIFHFPSAYPFILPKYYYSGKPVKPVLTIAVRDILVALNELNNELVYDVTKTITENKAQLIQMDEVYSILDTEINDSNFSFPLHQGAMNYRLRDKPSIWIGYARDIWPFVSMLAILVGLIASVRNRLKRQRKDRINGYYKDLLFIRRKALKSDSNKEDLLNEIQKLRHRAFDALSNNALQADEPFTIFLSLYSEVKNEINSSSVEDAPKQ